MPRARRLAPPSLCFCPSLSPLLALSQQGHCLILLGCWRTPGSILILHILTLFSSVFLFVFLLSRKYWFLSSFIPSLPILFILCVQHFLKCYSVGFFYICWCFILHLFLAILPVIVRLCIFCNMPLPSPLLPSGIIFLLFWGLFFLFFHPCCPQSCSRLFGVWLGCGGTEPRPAPSGGTGRDCEAWGDSCIICSLPVPGPRQHQAWFSPSGCEWASKGRTVPLAPGLRGLAFAPCVQNILSQTLHPVCEVD